jgi:hypothetical protein
MHTASRRCVPYVEQLVLLGPALECEERDGEVELAVRLAELGLLRYARRRVRVRQVERLLLPHARLALVHDEAPAAVEDRKDTRVEELLLLRLMHADVCGAAVARVPRVIEQRGEPRDHTQRCGAIGCCDRRGRHDEMTSV